MQQYTVLCFVMPFTALNVCTTPINTSSRRQFVYKDAISFVRVFKLLKQRQHRPETGDDVPQEELGLAFTDSLVCHQTMSAAEETDQPEEECQQEEWGLSEAVITPGNMTCESKRYPNGTISTCVNATGLGTGRFSRNSDLNNKQIIVNIENNLTPEFNIHIDNPPDGMESPNIVCKKIEGFINGPNKTVTQIISCRQENITCEIPNCKKVKDPFISKLTSNPPEFSTHQQQPDIYSNLFKTTNINEKKPTETSGLSDGPTTIKSTNGATTSNPIGNPATSSTPHKLTGSTEHNEPSSKPSGPQSSEPNQTGNSPSPGEPQKSTESTDTSTKLKSKSPTTNNLPSSTIATQEIPSTKKPCIIKPTGTKESDTLNSVTPSHPTGTAKSNMPTRPTNTGQSPRRKYHSTVSSDTTPATQEFPPTRKACKIRDGLIPTSDSSNFVSTSHPTATNMPTMPSDTATPLRKYHSISFSTSHPTGSGELPMSTDTSKKPECITHPPESSYPISSTVKTPLHLTTQEFPSTKKPCITKPRGKTSTSSTFNFDNISHLSGASKTYIQTRTTDIGKNPSTKYHSTDITPSGVTPTLPKLKKPCITKPRGKTSTSGTLNPISTSHPTGSGELPMSTDTSKKPECITHPPESSYPISSTVKTPLHLTTQEFPSTKKPCITKPRGKTSTSGTLNPVSTSHPTGSGELPMSTDTSKKPECITHPPESSYPISSTVKTPLHLTTQEFPSTKKPCITKPRGKTSTSGTLNPISTSHPTGSGELPMSTDTSKKPECITHPPESSYPMGKTSTSGTLNPISTSHPTGSGELPMSTDTSKKPECITHPPESSYPMGKTSTSGTLNPVSTSHPTGSGELPMSTDTSKKPECITHPPESSYPISSTVKTPLHLPTQEFPSTKKPCITKPRGKTSTSSTLNFDNISHLSGASKTYIQTRTTDIGKNPSTKYHSTDITPSGVTPTLPKLKKPCITKPRGKTSTSGTLNPVSTSHPTGSGELPMSTDTSKKPECITHPPESSYPISSTVKTPLHLTTQEFPSTKKPCITKPRGKTSTSGTLNPISTSHPTGSGELPISTDTSKKPECITHPPESSYPISSTVKTPLHLPTQEFPSTKKPCITKPRGKTSTSSTFNFDNISHLSGASKTYIQTRTTDIGKNPSTKYHSTDITPSGVTPTLPKLKKPCITKPRGKTSTSGTLNPVSTSHPTGSGELPMSTDTSKKPECITHPPESSYPISSTVKTPLHLTTQEFPSTKKPCITKPRGKTSTSSTLNFYNISHPTVSGELPMSTEIDTKSSIAGMKSSTSMPSGPVCFNTCQDECRQKCTSP